MVHEERIRRLREQGLLSHAQAAMLHDSLRTTTVASRALGANRGRRAGIIAVAIVIVIALWLGFGVFTDTGSETTIQTVSESMNQPGGPAMNKGVSTIVGAVVFLLIPIVLWAWLTNSLVTKEESVFAAWAQVESNYQRRSDLIPPLIEMTGRYLKHESETLTGVVEARSAGAVDMERIVAELIEAQRRSASQIEALEGEPPADASALAQLAASEQLIGLGMRKLMALAEAYPTLRSADQFLELQAQLEGTENRINVARMRFNEVVRAYNAAIRKLPGNLVARVNGFQRKAYFEADEGSRDAGPLEFD